MSFRRFTAILVIAILLVENLFILTPTSFAAPDPDGSANIDLTLTPSLPASSIVGQSFTLDITLKNENTSDGDGYRPGFILSLPIGISLQNAGTLGSPSRTVVHASGSTLYFFQSSNDVILKGLTARYPITLGSSSSAGIFVARNIGVLAYVDDNIYGRGSAPVGSPPGTLTGGIDYASGSGVSMPDPTNLTFPTNVSSGTNLSTLPFISPSIQFTPFDVVKTESTANLIGDPITTTLTIRGNSMGPLRHFHLQDILPSDRAFLGFLTSTGVNIGGLAVTYNAPGSGQATLDITDVTVPTNTDITILYQSLPLAYTLSSYSGSTPILDTGTPLPHTDPSINTVTMHTGGLALVGGPYPATTWNNGVSDIAVNQSSMLSPRSVTSYHRYANLAKTADRSEAVIGDIVTYTITLDTARNAAFTTNGSGTYITDILPDGMVFSGALTSTLSGAGTPFTYISSNTDTDGDTTILWRLNSGIIGADTTATIRYQAVVDGAYEGAGDTQYENTETLVNRASFFGTVGDGGLTGTWGETDPSIIDTTIFIDNITATVVAPTPTTKKHLISVTTPTGTVYDHTTGLPSTIPAGSRLRFALTMDFPNVNFIAPRLIDALPLLSGPNENAYDFAFQTNPALTDIYNSGVLYNTEDGSTPASTFNGLSLLGTTYPNAAWITATPANNLEFSLGNGVGEKTFAILFTVDVLATRPAGGVSSTGLVPLTNFAYSSFNDDTAVPNPLPIMNIPFDVNFPFVTATKSASGGTNVESGKRVDYTITLTNSGTGPAYLQNIIDTLPANMDLLTGSIVSSGSAVELPNSSITQSGNTLRIEFSTGVATGGRSLIPLDTGGTPSVRENIIVIRYSTVPNTNFLIQGGATRTNIVTLDYYASSGAIANGVNNLGPVTTQANVTVKSPLMSRSLFSTTEADSTTNNLYVGEEAIYRTIITLPQGTFSLANYTETNNANLQYLTGVVTAYSGSLTFSTGTVFSGASLPFGTIINTDTDTSTLETIVIDTTYRVIKNATAGTNYANNATMTYSSTSLPGGAVNVNVRKPTLTLTKVASPTTGQYGTSITYTVTLNNTSTTAHAYDIALRDIFPSRLSYITGSLSAPVWSGTENDFFASGIILDVLGTNTGRTFTFQATPTDQVDPAEVITNQVIALYDTLDDDLSLYEWTGSVSGGANFTVTDITLSHTIDSTTLADTSFALFSGSLHDVAIGEGVIYRTNVNIPETSFTGLTVIQTLPAGMKFLSGYILYDGVKTHTLTSISISPENIITFSLGDVDNTGIGSGTGFVLITEAVTLSHGSNTAGTQKTSVLQANFASQSRSVNRSIEIVEPTLSILKSYSPNSGDAGDTIATTVTVTNISQVHAYDVVLTDLTPNLATAGIGYSGTISIGTLAPLEVRNYTYNTVINPGVFPGNNLTGTASVLYTSHPGVPVDGERSYTVLDTDTILIINSGAIILDRVTPEFVTIGDVSSYQIRVPVSEGSTDDITITSTLPTGTAILSGSISITTSAGLTYSGTVTPVISPFSESILAGQTQTITYTFTNLVNTDTDNGAIEYITIDYDAILLDSVDTNIGGTKTHTANANYQGGAILKNASSLPITIIEPTLNLTISNSYINGYTVPYTFTITNTGTSTAYDLDLSTLIPSGISYTGTITITNSGGAVNLTRVGDTFRIESLPPGPSNPLIFRIDGAISEPVINGTVYTLTGSLEYTSQPGIYTPSITNVLNRERNGGGGVDDYRVVNRTTAFTLNLALLDESISVIDIDGGIGMIDDVFEYTITLTNTGTVPLSGIPVTLDIPAGFTGFTMISIPPGSTDLSTLTGGMNSVGYLSVTGITIPVGQSRTIVYQVTAPHTITPPLTIPTTAQVGNSLEGAIGGAPSVPVTIHSPVFTSSALETDRNGGSLYDTEEIRHTLSLSNSGTATGTNLSVLITWSTGAIIHTGSFVFLSGTLAHTGTLFIDELTRRITFTIPALPPGITEVFVFDSRASGPAGTTIQTEISATSDESLSTTSPSNILTIISPISPTPGSGGGGGGGGGTSGSPTVPTSTPVTTPVIVAPPKNDTKPVIKKPIIQKIPKKTEPEDLSISEYYANYLRDKKRLTTLVQEEMTAGILGIKYPKVLPQTGKTILERVKKLTNAKLALDPPQFTKGGEKVSDDLAFWLEDLPLADRDRDQYIVLPSNGMITPINTVPENITDYTRLVSGREIDVNKYLRTGVMTYPGTNNKGFGSIGNTVIFGHSSYYQSDSGRYKTHFQKIIELEAGEEIWVYEKNVDGSYSRKRYITTASYDTKANDTSVLAPGIGKNLTLFTCTPIGGITGRWIVKAKYIDEEKLSLENRLYGKSLTATEKKSIDSLIQKMRKLPLDERKKATTEAFQKATLEEKTAYNQYLMIQLARVYHDAK